jgi:hypothetical protein
MLCFSCRVYLGLQHVLMQLACFVTVCAAGSQLKANQAAMTLKVRCYQGNCCGLLTCQL